jgi:hypothetical protein
MKALFITTINVLLCSCAVFNYQPKLIIAGDPNEDLQDCKQLSKNSAVNASSESASQVSVNDRFKSTYDNCMGGRGHNVLR